MPHATQPANASSPVRSSEDEELPDAPSPGNDGEDGVSEKKEDVKLEDLFNDEESDEEFASSGSTLGKVESSPPAAPV